MSAGGALSPVRTFYRVAMANAPFNFRFHSNQSSGPLSCSLICAACVRALVTRDILSVIAIFRWAEFGGRGVDRRVCCSDSVSKWYCSELGDGLGGSGWSTGLSLSELDWACCALCAAILSAASHTIKCVSWRGVKLLCFSRSDVLFELLCSLYGRSVPAAMLLSYYALCEVVYCSSCYALAKRCTVRCVAYC